MNIYNIESTFDSQIYCVVAENMGEAERIFKGRYSYKIKSIKLYNESVLIQKYNEQKKDNK